MKFLQKVHKIGHNFLISTVNFENQRLNSLNLQRAVLIAVILFLIIFFGLFFDIILAKVKDSKRVTDLHQLQKAISVYRLRFGKFPQNISQNLNGWEVSCDLTNTKQVDTQGAFLQVLLSNKIIDKPIKDPVNSSEFYYRYKYFPAGSYGCQKAFYVLQAVNFENSRDSHGKGACPQRNFVSEIPNGYTIQVFE